MVKSIEIEVHYHQPCPLAPLGQIVSLWDQRPGRGVKVEVTLGPFVRHSARGSTYPSAGDRFDLFRLHKRQTNTQLDHSYIKAGVIELASTPSKQVPQEFHGSDDTH